MNEFVDFIGHTVWPTVMVTAVLLFRKELRELSVSLNERVRTATKLKVSRQGIELEASPLVIQTDDVKGPVEVYGDPDRFKLLFKAGGPNWVRSTKAMEVHGGCVVQVSTKFRTPEGGWNLAEAVAFVPSVIISPETEGQGHYLAPNDKVVGESKK